MRTVSPEDISRLRRIAGLLDVIPVVRPSLDEERRLLVRTIAGYLVPRLEQPDEPILMAVAGGDGVGKSHLVNLIVGDDVVVEGPLRPTTRVPALVRPERQAASALSAVVRKLRSAAPSLEERTTDAVVSDSILLVDLPATIDEASQRRMLGFADLVLFVTSPARYADAATWAHLQELAHRSIPVWVVLNRVLAEDEGVQADLETRLERLDADVRLFTVSDGPEHDAGALLRAVSDLAGDGRERLLGPALRDRTAQIVNRTAALTFPLDDVRSSGERLLAIADEEYEAAAQSVAEMVGGSGLGPGAAAATWVEVAERLAGVVTHRVGVAAERTAAAWQVLPDGAALLAAGGHELWRHPPDTARSARDRLLDWERELGPLVAEHTRRRLHSFKLGQVVAAVRSRALGDETKPKWRIRRRLATSIDVPATKAKERLAEIAAGVVEDDKRRFVRRLGARPSVEAIAELRALVTQFDSGVDALDAEREEAVADA